MNLLQEVRVFLKQRKLYSRLERVAQDLKVDNLIRIVDSSEASLPEQLAAIKLLGDSRSQKAAEYLTKIRDSIVEVPGTEPTYGSGCESCGGGGGGPFNDTCGHCLSEVVLVSEGTPGYYYFSEAKGSLARELNRVFDLNDFYSQLAYRLLSDAVSKLNDNLNKSA